MSARVVVTGIGLITPLGADRESSWRGLVSGATATRWLDAAAFPWVAQDGARRLGPGLLAGAPALLSFNTDDEAEPIVALALHAADEALRDANLVPGRLPSDRTGCVLGTSKGGLTSLARAMQAGRNFPPQLWSGFLPNAPASAVARRFGLRGPLLCPVAACATGLASLLRGGELVRDGCCDIVLAGSTDASLQPALLASFQRLGVLARGFDDPAQACRPFDRRRTGFLVGEGAAVLVLERLESALERGARPYAEWLSGGSVADASGLTQLDPQAAGLTRLIGDVLRRADVTAGEIDYVSLHGTGTQANDLAETQALQKVLGRAARRVSCSSLKGALGHLLGAAGSVETAAALLALRDQVVPPTANLTDPDPRCDLDCTPQAARPRRIETVLKLSLGFGGHLTAGVFRRAAFP